MSDAVSSKYSKEQADQEFWRWLTENGTDNPDHTPPKVRLDGTLTIGSEVEISNDTGNPVPVNPRSDRQPIAGLSFSETLAPLGAYTTSWVAVNTYAWLDIHAALAASSAVTALIEFTNAADPNTTPPAAADIVRPISTDLGGSALGGIDEPSFGIPSQMQWGRITVTDITGGQTINVSTEGVNIPPTLAQVPLVTTLTDDFRAGIVKAALTGKQPDGDYSDVVLSGSDAGNSTTTPLTAGATFTGTARDTTGFVGGMVLVYSDVASGTNGILIEFSETSAFTTVHRRLTFTYSVDQVNEGQPFFFPTMQGEFYRVRYTTGPTQTAFILRAELLAVAAQTPINALDSNVAGTNVATMTRSAVMAENPSGDWDNIQRGPKGGLRTHFDPLREVKITRQTVGTSAVQIATTPLANRTSIALKAPSTNGQNAVIYIGTTGAVTTSTGYPLSRGDELTMELDGTNALWAIASEISQQLAILEAAE